MDSNSSPPLTLAQYEGQQCPGSFPWPPGTPEIGRFQSLEIVLQPTFTGYFGPELIGVRGQDEHGCKRWITIHPNTIQLRVFVDREGQLVVVPLSRFWPPKDNAPERSGEEKEK